MLRVLLTGGTGWLGQLLTRLVAEDPVLSDKFEVHLAFNDSQQPEWTSDKKKLVSFDIADAEKVDLCILSIAPHILIHFAAMSSPAACEKNPGAAMFKNCPTHLIESCIRHNKDCMFIFASTDLVYDGENAPYKVGNVTKPGTVYGKTKLAFEQEVLRLENGIVLRLSNMIGPRFVYRKVGIKFVEWMFEACTKRTTLGLRSDEIRSFVCVDDVLSIIRCILMRAFDLPKPIIRSTSNRIFNIGGPAGLSRFDLARILAEAQGVALQEISPLSAADFSTYVSDACSLHAQPWKVFGELNADGVRGSGIKNPRDVSMDVSETETEFGIKMTDARTAMCNVLKHF